MIFDTLPHQYDEHLHRNTAISQQLLVQRTRKQQLVVLISSITALEWVAYSHLIYSSNLKIIVRALIPSYYSHNLQYLI